MQIISKPDKCHSFGKRLALSLHQQTNTTTMKTVNEIRIEAIRVINNVITLKANVFNGCYSDKAALEVESKRLECIKNWAIANNQIQNIRHYLASKNFGQHNQFAASEIASFFNS